jgi:GNAT superfamily N-acetyltransferase
MHIRELLDAEYSVVPNMMRLLEPELSQDAINARMQTMRADGWRCIGVFADGSHAPLGIAGFSYRTHLFSGKVMYVENVVIEPAARGNQLGEQIMLHLQQLARAAGAVMVTLDAYQRNSGAQKFYQRLGYDPRGVHFVLELAAQKL